MNKAMEKEGQTVIFERMLQKLQLELGNKSIAVAELSTLLELERGKVKELQTELEKWKKPKAVDEWKETN